MIPTGNETEIVKAYYDYLYSTYFADIALDRATSILVSSPIKIFAWGILLIGLLYLMTRYMYNVHRGHQELYEATSFAGSLVERNGKVSWFTWIFAFGLILSILYLGIRYIFLGFLY